MSSVHEILQARILEWVAISFSRGSSQPRDQTQVSCIADRCFTVCATRKAILKLIIYLWLELFVPCLSKLSLPQKQKEYSSVSSSSGSCLLQAALVCSVRQDAVSVSISALFVERSFFPVDLQRTPGETAVSVSISALLIERSSSFPVDLQRTPGEMFPAARGTH